MATEPKTYRISPEVDAELRKLAKEHGGVDRGLRSVLDMTRDARLTPGQFEQAKAVLARPHTIHSRLHPIPGCRECAELADGKAR